MKTILRKISVLFLISVILNFVGCATRHANTQDQTPTNQDAKSLQESMQQISSSIQPTAPDIMEGPVPPVDKNITMYYYVQNGDTLCKIAKQIYGTTSAWKKLAEMNNLKDPNHIYAGDFIHYELTQPAKAFADAYENVPRAKIVVKKGDTLGAVARSVFGKASDWRVLWKENPKIKNPDKLIAGQSIFFRPRALKLNDTPPGNVTPVAPIDEEPVAEAAPTAVTPDVVSTTAEAVTPDADSTTAEAAATTTEQTVTPNVTTTSPSQTAETATDATVDEAAAIAAETASAETSVETSQAPTSQSPSTNQ